MYYLYHIPGRKIGVTRNLNKRITKEQGYKPGEYEVLLQTHDISLVSRMELKLQKLYGYKQDRQSYESLIKLKKMKINSTEATTTFPVPLADLKEYLNRNSGATWKTPQNFMYTIDANTVDWILKNAKTSMYNTNRCYIYNKSIADFYENSFYENDGKLNKKTNKPSTVFDDIRKWAKDRGIYDKGNSQTQYIKLMEEAGELAQGLLKARPDEIKDAIGDMVVVLTNLAELEGFVIEDCIESVYKIISKRKGEMIGGTFVKQTL